jgi:hypothetical protein
MGIMRNSKIGIAIAATLVLSCSEDTSTPNTPSENDAGMGMNDGASTADGGNTNTNTNSNSNSSSPDSGDDPNVVTAPGVERRPVAFTVLPPVPSDCANPGSRVRLPFVYSSTDFVPIVAGDVVGGDIVAPNVSLNSANITTRRTRIAKLSEDACTTSADCLIGFRCGASGLAGAQRQCVQQTGLEFIPHTIEQDFENGLIKDDKHQLVAVLIENTSMLEGRLPTDSGALFDDSGEKDLLADNGRASDPTRMHRDALKDFLIGLASVAKPTNTQVSVWWFGGQLRAEARPLVAPEEFSDHFTNDLSIGEALIDGMPNPVPKPSNLYQAIHNVIEKDFGLDKYKDHEKFLFVFTDGPNEVHDPDSTYETALTALNDAGIHVYVVHLDAEIDSALVRDLPAYWKGNNACREDPTCPDANACASDDDCQSFETCRPVTIYGETRDDPVTTTPLSYCLPKYEDNRLGPISALADLACNTGGNYFYTTEPEAMGPYWKILPSTIDGQFSVKANLSALADPRLAEGFYRLSGSFIGFLGNKEMAYPLSTPIPGAVTKDVRPVVRLGAN